MNWFGAWRSRFGGLLAAVAVVSAPGGLAAQTPAPPAQANRIEIVYEPPKNPAHAALYESVRSFGMLERFRDALAPFRLPRALTAKIAGCDGDINAFYENDVITVCYEYLDYLGEVSRSRQRPAWISEKAAMLGPTLDVFFHEGAHALFEYLKIPILGREEDAADQMSALSMLYLGGKDVEELIGGVAFMYLDESGFTARSLWRPRLRIVRAATYADEHSTPLQRKYNPVCIAHGADPERFKRLVAMVRLPPVRAEQCELEYKQAIHAFRTLLLPHVDKELARRESGADNPLLTQP